MMDLWIESLKIMLMGMLGIFSASLAMMAVMALLGRLFPAEKEDDQPLGS